MYPVWYERPHLTDFLRYPLAPLSEKAAAGFLKRARLGSLRFPPNFLEAVEVHLSRFGPEDAVA